MTSDAPVVAFAVPVYDGAAYLGQALDALRAQTETRWVAVVTDNASTDATPEIAQRAAAQDARIRYVRNDANLGANGNFNRSMALAVETGVPFVKWAAHDDRPHPGYLAACLDALRQRPDAVGAHSAIRLVDGDGQPYPHDPAAGGFWDGDDLWRWSREWADELDDALGRRLYRFMTGKHGEWMVYGLFRADAVAATRPFAMPGVEDALCVELLARGPMLALDEVLFDHRLHAGSARHLSRRDYIEYETGVRPEGLLLPSAGRAGDFVQAIRRVPLSLPDRARAWGALARFALDPQRLRNVVVPGPDNYFGIGG